ncbi:response regulator transcription factor [Haloferula rosea]|uniref:Helix-turn-helix transcriptional regulator n=1 Tax=Haloferula rosea TaxID=490093 RepID=A0A934V9Q2_9BACT|nr:helix-turn-helix transcriptional regulator [Haloferula rosea]MBK1825483.1 helix-turn-helix transcriptional regulator [Haloferula rosea]
MFTQDYFDLALQVQHADSFDRLSELLTEKLPKLIGGDGALIFVTCNGHNVEEVHGKNAFAQEAKQHVGRINQLFSIHPLASKVDLANPGELGLSVREYVSKEEYMDSEFLKAVHQKSGMEDGLFGLLAHGNDRTTLLFVIKHKGSFSLEERQTFDALLLTARSVARLIANENVGRQIRQFYLQHSSQSAQALFLAKEKRDVLPFNHCALRLSENWWSEDDPVFTLSPDDQATLAEGLKKAWSDPLSTCFCEVELNVGSGRQKVNALPTMEGEAWLILCLVEQDAVAEGAIQALLTRRQREIMEWIAEGKTSAEAAIILDISPRTVEKHLEAVFQRLGVENRITAVRRYLELRSGQVVV